MPARRTRRFSPFGALSWRNAGAAAAAPLLWWITADPLTADESVAEGAKIVSSVVATPDVSAAPAASDKVDFAETIWPIFVARCHKCHGAADQQAGLRLDVRDRALQGGDSGLAIAPGDVDASLLFKKIASDVDDEAMPPDGARLDPAEQEAVGRWIAQGAHWPEDIGVRDALAAGGTAHWAFQPLAQRPLPDVRKTAWIRNPIDRFVLARLEQEGLSPAPEADRRTLARRLSLDLLGLPPAPEVLRAFINDKSDEAYELLVDQLLASEHFGERWGRHWLDLARYGDSQGYENDGFRPHAYRYRDWVVRAFNDDAPFDRFTIEQLAGDLLPNATEQQRIAAGFHRNSIKHGTSENVNEEYRVKAVKDRTDTTGAVWLGLTVGCAQCHSHKFDPLTQREYYGLYAFFNSADDLDEGEVQTLKEVERVSHVHLRGDYQALGAQVDPDTPAFLPPMRRRAAEKVDRLDLAHWIVDAQNPLTPRVAANWTWQHLFGQGLVPTPEDFGVKGEGPSHPELLDWLARHFVDAGWRRKELIRTIVLSATYRQASRHRVDLETIDPRNTLLARQNRFRLEAEIVRDASLWAAGRLNLAVGGAAIQPPLPDGVRQLPLQRERLMEPSAGPDRYRRGIYVNVQRTFPHPMMAMFDVADSNQTCPRRDRSNTPLQALAMLNDPIFVDCAQGFGRRLRENASEDATRIDWAFELCMARLPTQAERDALVQLWRHAVEHYRDAPEAARQAAGADLPKDAPVDASAASVAVAATLLNLEEFITRE